MVVIGLQSVGAREKQEDAFRIIPGTSVEPGDDLLLLLADGMGGHAGGEIASALIVDEFAAHCIERAESPRPLIRMRSSLDAANAALRARKDQMPELADMGATLISAIKLGDRLAWLSVGDSLLYLFRAGRLSRLNADHSVHGELMELVRAGKMKRQDADSHPRRNALRSAVIGDSIPLVDGNTITLEPNDVILLASDGIATLSDDRIAEIIAANHGDDARAISSALLNAVDAARSPRQDNTTIICYRYGTGRDGRRPESLFAMLADDVAEPKKSLPVFALVGAICAIGLAILVYLIGFSQSPPPPSPPAAAPAQPASGVVTENGRNPATIADDPDEAAEGGQIDDETTGPGADEEGVGTDAPPQPDEDVPQDDAVQQDSRASPTGMPEGRGRGPALVRG